MRIPISTKIIGLTVSILIGATALIARQSSEFFQKVMIQREDYSNMSEATARSKEIENLLNGAFDRAQIIGTLLMKKSTADLLNTGKAKEILIPGATSSDNNRVQDLDELTFNFNKDKNMVSIEVIKLTPQGNELLGRKIKEEFFKQAKVSPSYIADLRTKVIFPVASVAQKNIEVRNSSIPKGPPLITIGIPLAKDENGLVTHVALADLQMGLLQKPFANESERIFYLIDKSGRLLAHQDENKALANESMSESPIVEKAISDTTPRRQTRFIDPTNDKAYIGAYVKSPFWGVTVVAQTAEEIILEPAREVQRKAYYISGIVISIALFLCFLFSMTITSPIEKLAEMIKVVSKGNFDVKARTFVKSQDEVGDLATAFDNMTDGLKERDKVKSLFSKFHGSSVAEDLIKNDIGVGGSNKNVTVFFSDIRGFTKFSEGRTPEEVVTMLNEYFAAMVKIINANGGVVDKFIGDAIMAVWGAPRTDEKDTFKAVKACLEMRQALEKLNMLRRSRGQTDIMIGMGLHCGQAISGTIGSDERMEYTVIGDTVNMTSRIESSTKAFGSDLLVSEAIFNKVSGDYMFELAGSAEVKGKSEPLKMFKVRGYKDSSGKMVEVKTEFSDYQAEDAEKVKMVS
jgi:adenylate cyclase